MTDNQNDVNVQTEQNVKTEENQNWECAFENGRNFAPFVDIYETKDEFVLVANMPGISKENVKLKFEEGSLSIFGKVDFENLLKRKYLLKETEIGNYYRKFKLSDSIDESKIEASYENGQLTVKLPKHERVKPRTINIK